MRVFRLFLLLAICLLLAPQAEAKEVIKEFISDITINDDSSLTVTETIKVVANHNRIKRGIYRDFPTDYNDRYGNKVRVGFEVIEVLRNGKPEPHHVKKQANGKRIYFGKKEVFVPKGEHTYTLTYETTRQLGFFEGFDELYWNVTGDGWAFPIQYAEANVYLPTGARALDVIGYTGKYGEQGRDYRTDAGAAVVNFNTTKVLSPGRGFTIAVSWPKGYVKEPTDADRWAYFLDDNLSTFTTGIILIVLLVYYFIIWLRVGQDIPAGTIIPLFSPPRGFSPASLVYIMNMGFGSMGSDSNKAFSAALVNMAVKGYLKIVQEGKKFTLEKIGSDVSSLSPGEKAIATHLFGTRNKIELKQKNHKPIGKAKKNFKKRIKAEYEGIYFKMNSKYLFGGLVITIIALANMIITADDQGLATFMSLWLTLWTFGTAALFIMVISKWKAVFLGNFESLPGAIFITAFATPFFIGQAMGIMELSKATSIPTIIGFMLIVFSNVLFSHLLKAPTMEGRDMMDKIEGFKLYLSVAEKYRLEKFHPPAMSPEVFEKYLPYALALGVENEWNKQFTANIPAEVKRNYRPRWYRGSSWDRLGTRGMCKSLSSSLSNTISSSSRAPGSSSGSGGGGFSGGGGGGGGGGGW